MSQKHKPKADLLNILVDVALSLIFDNIELLVDANKMANYLKNRTCIRGWTTCSIKRCPIVVVVELK